MVGYADVQVNLKDINDNAPTFPQGIYFGNVTENGTAGNVGLLFHYQENIAFFRFHDVRCGTASLKYDGYLFMKYRSGHGNGWKRFISIEITFDNNPMISTG